MRLVAGLLRPRLSSSKLSKLKAAEKISGSATTAISNFFKKSQRYSQVANRNNQKNFNNFVWTPLGSRVNTYINCCLQVHFNVSAAWYGSHYLSTTPVANLQPVSLIPVAICHRCCWHQRQICRQYRWHRWQICHPCQQHKRNRWNRWCTLTCEYLREFSKKFEMTLMLFSGAWGMVIHEKNLKQKILWHCLFNLLENQPENLIWMYRFGLSIKIQSQKRCCWMCEVLNKAFNRKRPFNLSENDLFCP